MLKPYSAIALALFACSLPFTAAADELNLQADAFVVSDDANKTPFTDNGPITITDQAEKPKAEELVPPAQEPAPPAEETKDNSAKKSDESSSCSTKCDETNSCGEECE